MIFRLVALVLITSICAAQTPTDPPASPSSSATLTVPQGTLVALKLISSIKSKSTRPGDPVRAAVSFPLAIRTQVAIPAGTYVEGVVDKVNAHPSRGAAATVQIRFTRLLFANGYSVPLVAINQVAVMNDPRLMTYELADARDGAPFLGEAFAAPGQNPPQLPPLPSVGPSRGEIIGIGLGATFGVLILTLALGHHRAGSNDFILFDSGWQFEMAVQEPLTLDAAQVSAAAAIPR